MTTVVVLLRLAGRLLCAAADEMARVMDMQRLEVPDVVPAWMDEEIDL